MALIQQNRLYEFLARVSRVGGADRVVGMHAINIVEVIDDATSAVLSATPQSAVALDWDGLAALMHTDDRVALIAALQAAEAA